MTAQQSPEEIGAATVQREPHEIRLAIVVNQFPKLSESFIVNKVVGLRRLGFNVSVLVHDSKQDLAAFEDKLEIDGIDFIRHAPISQSPFARLPSIIRATAESPRPAFEVARRIARQKETGGRGIRAWILALPLIAANFDIVHFETSGLAVLYREALPFLAGIKLVTSCRGSAERISPIINAERREQLRDVFERMDRVHCVSDELRQRAAAYGLQPSKAFVNHPAVDPEQFRRTTEYPRDREGPFKLISIGRLVWSKGLEYALGAVRRLLDLGYDIRYDVIGDGPEEDRLRFECHDLALTQHVRLLGRQPGAKVKIALEDAHVCIVPSLSEGLSNVALEAMAMEVPVISTNVGGMSELIEDGLNGMLVPPRRPEALAQKVAELIDSDSRRKEMGKNGRQNVVDQFNVDRQVNIFAQEYCALASWN